MKRLSVILFFVAAFVFGACDDGATSDDSSVEDTQSAASDASASDSAADTGGPSQTPEGTATDDASNDTNNPSAGDPASDTVPDTQPDIPADTATEVDTSVLPDTSAVSDDTVNDSTPADTGYDNATGEDTAAADSGNTDTVADTDTTIVPKDTDPADTETEQQDAPDSETAQPADSDIADTTDTDDSTDDNTDNDSENDSDNDTPCVPTLIINEVDYDVPGKDTAEFVELYNPTACDMPLAGLSLILVNGSDMSEYRRIALSDSGVETVPANSYLLVHGAELALTVDVPAVEMTLANGFIQNGPDGLALYDDVTQSILDAFCYEESMTEVWFDNVDAPFTLVEGDINPELSDTGDEGVSLSRIPNGADSGNSAADWAISTATPGAENIAQ